MLPPWQKERNKFSLNHFIKSTNSRVYGSLKSNTNNWHDVREKKDFEAIGAVLREIMKKKEQDERRKKEKRGE